jgi:hypothetical protein
MSNSWSQGAPKCAWRTFDAAVDQKRLTSVLLMSPSGLISRSIATRRDFLPERDGRPFGSRAQNFLGRPLTGFHRQTWRHAFSKS